MSKKEIIKGIIALVPILSVSLAAENLDLYNITIEKLKKLIELL